jgi:hypothetical protein
MHIGRILRRGVLGNLLLGKPRIGNVKNCVSKVVCEDGRCMELSHDRAQWQASVLVVVSLRGSLSRHLSAIFSIS